VSKTFVLNSYGSTIFQATAPEVDRMLRLHQAVRVPGARGRALQLLAPSADTEHPCRTHTARGDLTLAAVGRSQQYTISERQRVTGFKSIYPEDRPTFNAATLDCMVTAS